MKRFLLHGYFSDSKVLASTDAESFEEAAEIFGGRYDKAGYVSYSSSVMEQQGDLKVLQRGNLRLSFHTFDHRMLRISEVVIITKSPKPDKV